MDLSKISLGLSLFSIGIASASAIFSWRQAKAAEAQLKRKTPAFELTILPTQRADGWEEARFTARNVECVRMDWLAVEIRNRAVQVISVEDGYIHDGVGNMVMPEIMPVEKASNRLAINVRVSANKNPGGPTSAYNVTFAFRGPLKIKDVKHVWKWADE